MTPVIPPYTHSQGGIVIHGLESEDSPCPLAAQTPETVPNRPAVCLIFRFGELSHQQAYPTVGFRAAFEPFWYRQKPTLGPVLPCYHVEHQPEAEQQSFTNMRPQRARRP